MIFMGSSAEAETKRNEGQKETSRETIGKDPQRSAAIDKGEERKDGRREDWKIGRVEGWKGGRVEGWENGVWNIAVVASRCYFNLAVLLRIAAAR
jgi:hypothetical protein